MERAGLARVLGGVHAHGAGRIVIEESDARRFMQAFAHACGGRGEVFLSNPDWGSFERNQVDALLRATVMEKVNPELGWLMIPTGGTSGRVRFARHDAETITAAVRGFTRHFELPQVNAMGMLPLYHVSGFMAWMRCVMTGGEYRPLEWKAIERGDRPVLSKKAHGWVISLVPTQLERLLRDARATEWLRGFRIIFLGGAPAWPQLLDKAAAARLPLSPGYGMTETAAMIAAQRPEQFLAGARSNGAVLPHAQVSFTDEGAIMVAGRSVFHGYYPEWREASEPFVTSDGGYSDERGELHVTGRRDAVIITGGEKVDPVEVEAVLRGTGEFSDVLVIGVPDVEWGQRVIAVYPSGEKMPRLEKVTAAIGRLLTAPKRPKEFVAIPQWPVNAQGKINRAEVTRAALEVLRNVG
jgi:O-succinylbenzoic acid--CoA ligase